LSGIGNTLKNLFVNLRRLQRSANTVVKNILRGGGLVASARQRVNNDSTIMSKRLRDSAWNAERLSHRQSDPQNGHVALTVLTASKLKEKRPVYNLSVMGAHEFFANGILVHNCDSTRFLLASQSFGPAARMMNQAEKIQSLIPEGYTRTELAKTEMHPNQQHLTAEMAEMLAKRTFALRKPPLVDQFGQPLS
jgi:hypothetical protein